jgi:FKBP-type peptidyl-prolyl cis-trans isomerase
MPSRCLALALGALLLLPACQESSTQSSTAPGDTATSDTASSAPNPSLAASDTTRGNATGAPASRPANAASPDTTGAGPATISAGQYTTTASGLKYYDLREGSGASPGASDTVRVHYTGWLRSDSTQFDSSYERDRPVTFQLDRVIEGWTEGVQSMQVGGKRQLVIPPGLAYGQRGRRSIPPEATLVFQVELLGVKGVQSSGDAQSSTP